MRSIPILLVLLGLLAACGDDGPPLNKRGNEPAPEGGNGAAAEDPSSAPVAKDAAVKAALEVSFQLVRKDKNEEAAGHIVSRSQGWKSVCNYADPADKKRVDGMCARTKRLLGDYRPVMFEEFRSERESEGEWLVWKVAIGEGAHVDRQWFACLMIDGKPALGDIDVYADDND